MDSMDRTAELLNIGARLDLIGNTVLRLRHIKAYEVNIKISARNDCRRARRYYKKHMRVTDMEMHHTQDGYIVPVHKDLHRTPHIGGVVLLGLKR